MNKDAYSLYCLTSPSGKKYYGMSKRVEMRMKEHERSAENCKHALAKAIRKYGFASFNKEIICVGSVSAIRQLEISAIETDNTMVPFGYNLTKGGEGTSGYTHTEDERKRRSEWAKENCSDFLRIIGKNRIGKKVSGETKEKQSIAAKNRGVEYNKERAKCMHSVESRRKMLAYWSSEISSGIKMKLAESMSARARSQKNPTIGRVWINDGTVNKRVHQEESETFLTHGWVLGQLRKVRPKQPYARSVYES